MPISSDFRFLGALIMVFEHVNTFSEGERTSLTLLTFHSQILDIHLELLIIGMRNLT